MANRVLRDWTMSERIDLLSAEAEVFFTRLIMKADDYGRYHANPKLLKAALFPLKNTSESEIEKWLIECSSIKVINLYESDGKKYLQIDDFGQRLRQMNSKFPEPKSFSPTVDSKPPTVDSKPPPERKKETRNETKQETRNETNPEKFHPAEIAEIVNRLFGKDFTERKVPRFDLDIINDLITVYGYTKQEVIHTWENLSEDQWHKERPHVITLSYLSQTKTMERFSKSNSAGNNSNNQVFKRSNLNLHD